MNTYLCGDITICIGAEVTGVKYRGTPKTGLGQLVRDWWGNNYFRRHTKSYLTVKAAEIVCRSIGLHTLYLLLQEHKEYILVYLPILIQYLQSIDIPNLLLYMNVGYILGVLTTFVLKRLRLLLSDYLPKKG